MVVKLQTYKKIIMNDKMLAKKFSVLDVKGNGHCLFRSIAQTLSYKLHKLTLNNVDELKFALNIRRLSISEVCSHNGNLPVDIFLPETYKESISREMSKLTTVSFKRYCKCQYNIKLQNCHPPQLFTWGGMHEINAISNLLNTSIIVYIRHNSKGYDKLHFCKHFTKCEPLTLLYIHKSHYQALLPFHTQCPCK